jgi:hypothetical protein
MSRSALAGFSVRGTCRAKVVERHAMNRAIASTDLADEVVPSQEDNIDL